MARSAKAAAAPVVTVCVACFNAERHLASAIGSALRQTLIDIEVIVVDDGSTDRSVEIVREIAARDPRVRLEILPENLGPGGARNRAIELARGEWFAVLDSDDLFEPARLERLVARARADGADAIADDLILFPDGGPARDRRRFLSGRRAGAPGWIGLADYFDETRMFEGRANLGFLKPVISTAFLRRTGLRYDPALRIGEDDDLIARLLAAGLKYRLDPWPGYFYRKHAQSISHRIGEAHLLGMIERAGAMRKALAGAGNAVLSALARRERSFHRALSFVRMVEALKARRPGRFLALALRSPGALWHFRMPIGARFARLLPQRTEAQPARPAVAVISRQRVVGPTNGSSAYLLSLARAIDAAGLEPRFIGASPHLFGRWPVLPLSPEMSVFGAIDIRGGARLGRWIVSTDPARWWAAARAVAGVVLARLGLPSEKIAGAKAIYAVAAPWSAGDMLFVARHAPARIAAAVADYAFQTEALPFLISPEAPTAVVMHDLFHARAGSLAAQGASDGVAVISEAEERALLARAGAVIAIQKAEGDYVRRALPGSHLIVAPMAAEPVEAASPGADDRLLFVGSGTHPNVVGLRWFFDEVWPRVRAGRPSVRLTVAGSVNRAFTGAPEGVDFIGVAASLEPLYREAGIVISPLIVGSGLKIKLIEALAAGKATVATSITLQGVEQEAEGAVIRADDPAGFADAIVRLSDDAAARAALGERALLAARTHFGPEAAYADFGAWLAKARSAVFDAPGGAV